MVSFGILASDQTRHNPEETGEPARKYNHNCSGAGNETSPLLSTGSASRLSIDTMKTVLGGRYIRSGRSLCKLTFTVTENRN